MRPIINSIQTAKGVLFTVIELILGINPICFVAAVNNIRKTSPAAHSDIIKHIHAYLNVCFNVNALLYRHKQPFSGNTGKQIILRREICLFCLKRSMTYFVATYGILHLLHPKIHFFAVLLTDSTCFHACVKYLHVLIRDISHRQGKISQI